MKVLVANPPWPGEGYGARSDVRWPHKRMDKYLEYPIYLAYIVAIHFEFRSQPCEFLVVFYSGEYNVGDNADEFPSPSARHWVCIQNVCK